MLPMLLPFSCVPLLRHPPSSLLLNATYWDDLSCDPTKDLAAWRTCHSRLRDRAGPSGAAPKIMPCLWSQLLGGSGGRAIAVPCEDLPERDLSAAAP